MRQAWFVACLFLDVFHALDVPDEDDDSSNSSESSSSEELSPTGVLMGMSRGADIVELLPNVTSYTLCALLECALIPRRAMPQAVVSHLQKPLHDLCPVS
jgi:hypothetical protein